MPVRSAVAGGPPLPRSGRKIRLTVVGGEPAVSRAWMERSACRVDVVRLEGTECRTGRVLYDCCSAVGTRGDGVTYSVVRGQVAAGLRESLCISVGVLEKRGVRVVTVLQFGSARFSVPMQNLKLVLMSKTNQLLQKNAGT